MTDQAPESSKPRARKTDPAPTSGIQYPDLSAEFATWCTENDVETLPTLWELCRTAEALFRVSRAVMSVTGWHRNRNTAVLTRIERSALPPRHSTETLGTAPIG